MNLKNLIFYTFFIIFSCTLNPIKSATQTIALKKVSSTMDDTLAPFVEKINAFITQKANNIGLDRESMNKATTELETKLAQLHNLITYGAPYTKQENEATASSYTKNIGLGTGIATAGLISGAMAYDITKKLEDPDKVNYYPGKRTTRGRYRKPFTQTNKQEAISEILLTPFVAGFGGAVMGGLATLISANVLSQIMKEQNYTQDKINILLNEVKIKIKEYQEQANSGAIDPERKKLKTSFLTTIKEKFSNKDITKLSPSAINIQTSEFISIDFLNALQSKISALFAPYTDDIKNNGSQAFIAQNLLSFEEEVQRQRTLLRESSIHHFFKKDEILNLATVQQAFDTSIQQLRLHTMNAITIIYNHTTEMITKVLKEIAAQTKKLQEV